MYRQCNRCLMDTTAKDIEFTNDGTCNYCKECLDKIRKHTYSDDKDQERHLKTLVSKIVKDGKGKKYNCILGVSGGLDSSYLLFKVVELGLTPLAVHVDNGWNSELAVSNIEKLVKGLNVDLYTHVINWEEFRKIQKAHFEANVVDLESPTDHAITAMLYIMASRYRIKYILAGTNIANEGIRMPPGWNHRVKMLDRRNIKDITKSFSPELKFKTFPSMGLVGYILKTYLMRIKWVSFLNYFNFDKTEATTILGEKVGWRPYEKKHYESVFTRFYQGYILPKKFNIDKRIIHLSSLICSGQLNREAGIDMLREETYENSGELEDDKNYVLKKLGMTEEYFINYIKAKPIPHSFYESNESILDKLSTIYCYTKSNVRS